MFLRSTSRHKDGKDHRYFSVVENRRVSDGRVVQRQVLYLGEIHDSQEVAGRKTLEIFDESQQQYATLSLFPDDRPLPAEAIHSIQVKLLRSHLVSEDPAVLWDRYVQLTQIEAAFQSLKSELGVRPIYHQLEHRVEAHILIALLAYCLLVTLKNRLQALAPGLTPKAVLDQLATIEMLDVCLPTTDGRCLMPRYTQPEPDQQVLLHRLKLSLPPQPPPRLQASLIEFPPEALRL